MPPFALKSLSIAGFRSFRELQAFPLRNLNVLVGANGAGKSNFVEFFRMLRAMFQENLQGFVNQAGGANGLFFEGPQYTREIGATLQFAANHVRFRLEPIPGDELVVKELEASYAGHRKVFRRDSREARVEAWKNDASSQGDWPSNLAFIYAAVSSWVVYHFHDTSSLAPMRRDGAIEDHQELRPNADNLAAFLRHLRESDPRRYQRIRETIQIIAPFFDDFLLEPRKKGDAEHVRLDWRQRGSTFPYQPWQLSDGTIRFIALVTALLQPTPPATLVVDEPELGLHPAALHVLAALMHESSQQTQLVISTQSPLLVDNFEPEDIIVVRRRGAESVLERLDPAELERWLDEFSLGDLIRKNIVETGP
ncbi:AAA family ATPase [Nannocystis pusilla]|uniref:AAA family ATPase n=1 Tax=Nannocystis pusilla TaxID=889268 RepID=A0ABS7TW48_9BACT|nr:AAA family ATPase [Nannocystis pusilla]MBZ5712478.1 AAA family ATPase [Nannocystis pusilla]